MIHQDINKKYLELLVTPMRTLTSVTYHHVPKGSSKEGAAQEHYHAFSISHGTESIIVESVSPGFMLYQTEHGTPADILTIDQSGTALKLTAEKKPGSSMSFDEAAQYIFDILMRLSSSEATIPA